jgi:hypothetical protein
MVGILGRKSKIKIALDSLLSKQNNRGHEVLEMVSLCGRDAERYKS